MGRFFGSGSRETSEAGEIRILTNSATQNASQRGPRGCESTIETERKSTDFVRRIRHRWEVARSIFSVHPCLLILMTGSLGVGRAVVFGACGPASFVFSEGYRVGLCQQASIASAGNLSARLRMRLAGDPVPVLHDHAALSDLELQSRHSHVFHDGLQITEGGRRAALAPGISRRT
jgi:hypothetical protein